jgi:hypothetical protein
MTFNRITNQAYNKAQDSPKAATRLGKNDGAVHASTTNFGNTVDLDDALARLGAIKRLPYG